MDSWVINSRGHVFGLNELVIVLFLRLISHREIYKNGNSDHENESINLQLPRPVPRNFARFSLENYSERGSLTTLFTASP